MVSGAQAKAPVTAHRLALTTSSSTVPVLSGQLPIRCNRRGAEAVLSTIVKSLAQGRTGESYVAVPAPQTPAITLSYSPTCALNRAFFGTTLANRALQGTKAKTNTLHPEVSIQSNPPTLQYCHCARSQIPTHHTSGLDLHLSQTRASCW